MSTRRLGLIKKPSGGMNDPTDIANCVAWMDLSDAATMTFLGSAVDTITDKVNSAVWTKTATSTEYQHNGTHLIKLDLQPRYGSVYSSPIVCNNFTYIVLAQNAGTYGGGTNNWFENFSSGQYLSRSSGDKFRFRPTSGADTLSVTSIESQTVPTVISVTGGTGESQTIMRFDNVSDNSTTESLGITLGSYNSALYNNRNTQDLRPYQWIVYDRVLTTQEMIDIHAWLATKV